MAVTISDVAHAAGVSKGAVSYALNGQPGVSPFPLDLDGRPANQKGDCQGGGAADAGTYEYRPAGC